MAAFPSSIAALDPRPSIILFPARISITFECTAGSVTCTPKLNRDSFTSFSPRPSPCPAPPDHRRFFCPHRIAVSERFRSQHTLGSFQLRRSRVHSLSVCLPLQRSSRANLWSLPSLHALTVDLQVSRIPAPNSKRLACQNVLCINTAG